MLDRMAEIGNCVATAPAEFGFDLTTAFYLVERDMPSGAL